jgi:hypothetical protein
LLTIRSKDWSLCTCHSRHCWLLLLCVKQLSHRPHVRIDDPGRTPSSTVSLACIKQTQSYPR